MFFLEAFLNVFLLETVGALLDVESVLYEVLLAVVHHCSVVQLKLTQGSKRSGQNLQISPCVLIFCAVTFPLLAGTALWSHARMVVVEDPHQKGPPARKGGSGVIPEGEGPAQRVMGITLSCDSFT